MVEERVTQVDAPEGTSHTHTTVISDAPRSGSGALWIIVLLVAVLAVVAVFYLSGMSGSETAKDNAVAEAAQDVGDAAGQVGDAAQSAAETVKNR